MSRAALLFSAGILLLLLAVEALLQVLPVSTATRTGYQVDPLILTYPPQHEWTVSTGWDLRNSRRLRANNLGFVAAGDFTPDPRAIGLIGDSYVEAGMLDLADRPASQLASALLSHRPVYAMGGPGSALLDYAERIRFASERLAIHDFVVVMEAGDLRQSLCGSGNVHGPCLDRQTLRPRVELQPGPSWAKRLLRHSALAQYAVGQLKLDTSSLLPTALSPAPESAAVAVLGAVAGAGDGAAPALPPPPGSGAKQAGRDLMVETVAQHFFARIKPYVSGRLIFVVDGRRSAADLQSDAVANSSLMQERAAFIALARQHGATVVDAEPLYRQHWVRSGMSLEIGPYDRHLNRFGVGLLMRAVAESLS